MAFLKFDNFTATPILSEIRFWRIQTVQKCHLLHWELLRFTKNQNSERLILPNTTILDRLISLKFDFTYNRSSGKINKFQQSQALTSHFEIFWCLRSTYFQCNHQTKFYCTQHLCNEQNLVTKMSKQLIHMIKTTFCLDFSFKTRNPFD